MREITNYVHKKVLVLGLAKSGVGAAKLLHRLGAFVTVNDQLPLSDNPEAQGLLEQGMTVICGGHPMDLLDEGFELIVKNPGIPYHNEIIKAAIKKEIPIITEVELAYQISEAPFIAITGTNGKTTTTTLIYEMLLADNKKPLIAGNIGTVACDVAQEATAENTIVIELSSFQLMGIDTFRPRIACLTNLYDAHLDYHGTRKEYWGAKARITENQLSDDYFIFNGDQPEAVDVSKETSASLLPFTVNSPQLNGASIMDQHVCFNGEQIISLGEIVLPGKHNLENILCAVAAAKLSGVSNEAIITVLTTFTGVKHRLQFLGNIEGRRVYNDSKATNILATQKALSAFTAPTILLAGGLDRGNGFDELVDSFSNVKTLITFGQTAAKLEEAGAKAGIKTIVRVDNVEKAVPVAFTHSEPGDVILLSPACASWDQYKTFEVRGDMFIHAVHKL